LGRTRLSLAEVDDLRAGDIVRLDRHKTEPGILFVGGKPKYYAHPFAGADGHVQAEVAAKIPPQQQSDFGVVD